MADKRPTPPQRPRPPREGDGIRKGGGGWQKPVKPPQQENRPGGLPPKKPS
jgi:hypothetical protein